VAFQVRSWSPGSAVGTQWWPTSDRDSTSAQPIGKLNAMTTALAGTEAKLDAAHGKLDSAHDKLDALQASVTNVEALVALVHATQVRQESDARKANIRSRAVVFGGALAVVLVITCHHPAPPAFQVNIHVGTGNGREEGLPLRHIGRLDRG